MDNSTTTSSYTHKKLTAHKRKRNMDPGLESNTDNLIYQEQPVTKRRQTKAFFRPWLDNEQNTEASSSAACPPESPAPALDSAFRPNCASTPRQRSPQERSLRTSLLSRRAESHAHKWLLERMAVLQQQNLYYRYLLQQAVFQRGGAVPSSQLPQQQQQFLQQMALSQQMLVFGAQHRNV
ncbi:uncharacterized protein LOC111072513 [Drosophila obscura]|uniref:uncharacterized protein LOC111072513 n=1 Tax=Drosophila obscura TaxID=7282 RepID=UPI001BB1A7CC|nr:uncharacterized protein LOC111072513 [Drosophila obscura]